MKEDHLNKMKKEILTLNKEISDRIRARDIFRAQIRNSCKHNTNYFYWVMDPPNFEGKSHLGFICCICGKQSLVLAKPGDFPCKNQVPYNDFCAIIRDLTL